MTERTLDDHLSVGIRFPNGQEEKPMDAKNLFWLKPGWKMATFDISIFLDFFRTNLCLDSVFFVTESGGIVVSQVKWWGGGEIILRSISFLTWESTNNRSLEICKNRNAMNTQKYRN